MACVTAACKASSRTAQCWSCTHTRTHASLGSSLSQFTTCNINSKNTNWACSQARPTGKSVNGVREMSYTFEFMPNLVIGDFIGEGRYTQITRVTHKGADAGRDTLEQVWETVLYLPERPATAYLIDELPGGTFVNAKGQFEAQPAKAWLHAVPPAAFLLVNVACEAVVSVAW